MTAQQPSATMSYAIDLAKPWITQAEIDAVVDVLRSGRLSLGPKLPEFERIVADYCGTAHAVAVSSGTAGLHVLMDACGIGQNDEVITTPFSFIASANCTLMVGAKPVFVDIEQGNWNIDAELIADAITPRTRAILPVHVFGHPADMTSVRTLADRHGLRVVEDACEAFGSLLQGKRAGSLGDAAVFGFYPNKQIATGEGGIITTDCDDIAAHCRSLRNQGRDTNGGWLAHPRLGYNYRLSDIACAIGIEQVRRIDAIMEARNRIRGWYCDCLADEPRIVFQEVGDDVCVSWFVMVIRLADQYTSADRDRILQHLVRIGIGCSNYFVPIHLQPFYRERFGYQPGDFPVCEAVAARTIALPFHHALTQQEVTDVCRALRQLL